MAFVNECLGERIVLRVRKRRGNSLLELLERLCLCLLCALEFGRYTTALGLVLVRADVAVVGDLLLDDLHDLRVSIRVVQLAPLVIGDLTLCVGVDQLTVGEFGGWLVVEHSIGQAA